MSDKPQGPGWWQAIDGAWYPPEDSLVSGASTGAGTPSMAEASTVTQVASTVSGLPTMQAAPAPSAPMAGLSADLPAGTEVATASGTARPKVPPVQVPELPARPTWSGETDRRPEAGPMYPDLFSQAMSGSSLANVVTVNYADGEPRPDLDVTAAEGRSLESPDGEQILVSASARMPAQVGAFTGASAKKRWRILR